MSGKAKCANCALAEKQKNAGGAKIKSFRVGLCVAIFPFLSVCIVIVIIFSLSNGCLSQLQCLFYHCLQLTYGRHILTPSTHMLLYWGDTVAPLCR